MGLFPPEGQGYVCDVTHGDEYLRLFSAMNSSKGGWVASVYDMNANVWISKDDSASDREDGKRKAEEIATARLKADLSFTWKKTSAW